MISIVLATHHLIALITLHLECIFAHIDAVAHLIKCIATIRLLRVLAGRSLKDLIIIFNVVQDALCASG